MPAKEARELSKSKSQLTDKIQLIHKAIRSAAYRGDYSVRIGSYLYNLQPSDDHIISGILIDEGYDIIRYPDYYVISWLDNS